MMSVVSKRTELAMSDTWAAAIHLHLRSGLTPVPRGHVRPTRARRAPYGVGIPDPNFTEHRRQEAEMEHYQRQYDSYSPQGPQGPVVSVPVDVPKDPNGVLVESHAAAQLLAHDALVITR